MYLIEREAQLSTLERHLANILSGEGHCVFITGEAGIGKTSLVKSFCRAQKDKFAIYQGTCDALYTPRPLAPLYDISWQISGDMLQGSHTIADRAAFFASFYRELKNKKESTIIIFEDVHWADEATLDFIKFFVRRIALLSCLFIITYRDDEIYSSHPLRTVFGQLPPDSCSRLQLQTLSRPAVAMLAAEKGYKGEDVFDITGGNPFYVNEILASYNVGVPDNIKNAILSNYNGMDPNTRYIWDLLSVVPSGFETKYLERLDPTYSIALEKCFERRIILLRGGQVHFKHELFRRTVEGSLSPLKRVELNKLILDLFKDEFENHGQVERIIHHAKNANAYDVVVYYCPIAAAHAAAVGAHIEAARLYITAIEYYQGSDQDILLQFYEAYAYECYLTNNIKEAIIYTGKSLKIHQKNSEVEKTGNSLRFLSRLWWYDGNRRKALHYAKEAVNVLHQAGPSPAKAMALSNMSQLHMLSDQFTECVDWGDKAIRLARDLGDHESLCHALNNVGSAKMKSTELYHEGMELLNESLAIALAHSFHDHAARAYANIASLNVILHNYEIAAATIEKGTLYCEERDLDTCGSYILSWKARLNFETGSWDEANQIANNLLANGNLSPIVRITALTVQGRIRMRKTDDDVLSILMEAKTQAFDTMELHRMIPGLSALLEYEWLTGKSCLDDADLKLAIDLVNQTGQIAYCHEFYLWLWIARERDAVHDYSDRKCPPDALNAVHWDKLGCVYENAIALFLGDENDQQNALKILLSLGATRVYEKVKSEMRSSGIKRFPRADRQRSKMNRTLLTNREMDILHLLKTGLQNKEIAARLFISPKTVDHHISSVLFKLDANSRTRAVAEAVRLNII